MSNDSSGESAFAEAIFAEVAKQAEPIFKRKLAERGVASPNDLDREEARKIFRDSFMEGAVLATPDADFEMLRGAIYAMTDDRFTAALSALNSGSVTGHGAFDPAQGYDAAILLAGFGLPIVPLDRKTMRPLGSVAKGIDEADRVFSKFRTAIVGYEPATVPFFLAITDCANTLIDRLSSDSSFSELRRLALRGGGEMPAKQPIPFKHACMLIARLPGDELESFVLEDPSPSSGSVMVVAAWMDGDEPRGLSRGRYFMVPRQLLDQILFDPSFIHWLSRPIGLKLGRVH